jgi:hypothetical protein
MARRNLDGLVNAPPKAVAEISFLVIDGIQHHPTNPLAQAAGVAATFLLLCEHLKVEPQDVFVATKNILLDEREGGSKHFEAVRMFVSNEIPR